ncbi:MAG: hypothetical protein F6K09_03280 [Merismopedia sp. SIO2A8]|nr:hypothetical protein [Merismopedia sp. SIO2A8]
MATPESFSLNATIAPVAFTALQQTLQQATQFIRDHEPDADIFIVQETSLGFDPIQHLQVEQFTLVVSRSFSALLLANTSNIH